MVTPGELLAFAVAGAFVIGAMVLARKTRRRWVSTAVGLTLVAIVAVVWVVPLVVGPTLECVDVDPTVCDDVLRGYTEHRGGGLIPGTGLGQFFPVTKVRVEWDDMCGAQGSIEQLWVFTSTAICL